jgi:hypothetical protein
MNIFFLDEDSWLSAQYLCDKHIPKMLLETAQMLSTSYQRYRGIQKGLYKPAYENHPMTKWVGDSFYNWCWTYCHAQALSDEYTFRFKKIHKTTSTALKVIDDLIEQKPFVEDIFPHHYVFKKYNPPQCMPDEYKDNDYVTAYRNYYKGEKEYFAKWEKGRNQPEWWS